MQQHAFKLYVLLFIARLTCPSKNATTAWPQDSQISQIAVTENEAVELLESPAILDVRPTVSMIHRLMTQHKIYQHYQHLSHRAVTQKVSVIILLLCFYISSYKFPTQFSHAWILNRDIKKNC